MGKINDAFEVEVQLELCPAPVRLNVECNFELTEDGPSQLKLQSIAQLSESVQPLVFTVQEFKQMRFAVADAIERKYWSGEYQGSTDDTNITRTA